MGHFSDTNQTITTTRQGEGRDPRLGHSVLYDTWSPGPRAPGRRVAGGVASPARRDVHTSHQPADGTAIQPHRRRLGQQTVTRAAGASPVHRRRAAGPPPCRPCPPCPAGTQPDAAPHARDSRRHGRHRPGARGVARGRGRGRRSRGQTPSTIQWPALQCCFHRASAARCARLRPAALVHTAAPRKTTAATSPRRQQRRRLGWKNEAAVIITLELSTGRRQRGWVTGFAAPFGRVRAARRHCNDRRPVRPKDPALQHRGLALERRAAGPVCTPRAHGPAGWAGPGLPRSGYRSDRGRDRRLHAPPPRSAQSSSRRATTAKASTSRNARGFRAYCSPRTRAVGRAGQGRRAEDLGHPR